MCSRILPLLLHCRLKPKVHRSVWYAGDRGRGRGCPRHPLPARLARRLLALVGDAGVDLIVIAAQAGTITIEVVCKFKLHLPVKVAFQVRGALVAVRGGGGAVITVTIVVQ